MTGKKYLLATVLITAFYFVPAQIPHRLTVNAAQPAVSVQPAMWGVFFEDINFAADGGLYAELVKNRSFEFNKPMMGWEEIKEMRDGQLLIINRGEENAANPRFARITIQKEEGRYGLTNAGFRGMGLVKDKPYNFSVWAAQQSGIADITIRITDEKGTVTAEKKVGSISGGWKQYKTSIVAAQTDARAKLQVIVQGKGITDIDMVSLFPQDTWKQRSNGLRADLVQLLADMKPGFIRFPGGCIVEGMELNNRYEWKKTVGNPEDRRLIINRWNVEFAHRAAPDYFQSFGLGFYEYFLLAEDIGAAPLPILNCGMACQYNTAEVVPMNQLDPYIQDALDLVEFANGDENTKWGKLRAAMGHPAPFKLRLLGIGNEQWDTQYMERYKAFATVLKQKYPEVQLISGAGPYSGGALFDYAWKELRALNADLVDEHYYASPEWFLKNATRYDNYNRQGPKVFAGEYAAHSKDPKDTAESRNTWRSALAEAAFMTGLERNADVVHMASYAPLFAHVEAWQWRPDLIWFDNLRTVATPNYYVQKLFAGNRGTHVVPVLEGNHVVAGKDSLYASAVVDTVQQELIIKLVNANPQPMPVEFALNGITGSKKGAYAQVLTAGETAYNTLDKPQQVAPVTEPVTLNGKKMMLSVAARSLTVVHIPYK